MSKAELPKTPINPELRMKKSEKNKDPRRNMNYDDEISYLKEF